MKKIISLITACVLICSAVSLVSCDDILTYDVGDVLESTALSETDAATETELTPPAEPVEVDSVNGKNARQLFEKYMEELTSAKSYDMSLSMTSSEDGKLKTEKIEIKLNNNSMYMFMSMEDGYMKVWIVDGEAYVDMDGEKYKTNNINDVFGEDFFDQIMSEAMTEAPEEYLKKLEAAQLYSYNGEYYCTVKVSAEEAEQMTGGSEAYEETLYFGADGSVKRIVDVYSEGTQTLVMNSLGKPVTITKPADADSYIEKESSTGAGDQDPEVYAVYDKLCDTIGDMTVYTMYITLEGESDVESFGYEVDSRENKYVGSVMDGTANEIWYVGGAVYVSENRGQPIRSQYTDDVQSAFDTAEAQKAWISDCRVDGSLMDELDLKKYTENECVLSFTVYGDDTFTAYTFIFDENMSYISVYIDTGSGEAVEQSMVYEFNSINDSALQVIAPV